MAEIVPVVSEALEAQVRSLLPSQKGFGQDLQASNVIVPIIDLTPAAEGSTTPEYLQTALAFGSQTAHSIENTTTVIANSPGFYRIFGVATAYSGGAGINTASFTLSDGLSTKTVWTLSSEDVSGDRELPAVQYDFIVFLASGESVSGVSNSVFCGLRGSSRQVATVNGVAVLPSGFTPQ